MFLPHLYNTLLTEQRRPCTTQWRIRSNMDALFFAEIHNFLLWEVGVVFYLVCGGDNCCFCEEFLEEGDGEVCYAYCFYVA